MQKADAIEKAFGLLSKHEKGINLKVVERRVYKETDSLVIVLSMTEDYRIGIKFVINLYPDPEKDTGWVIWYLHENAIALLFDGKTTSDLDNILKTNLKDLETRKKEYTTKSNKTQNVRTIGDAMN